MNNDLSFPGESDEYRRERNRLLGVEIELRRAIEGVAAQRRALPPGGPLAEDYRFEEIGAGSGEVSVSELFAPGKDTLVIYSFMFPRWPGDTRPGPAEGETARLPLAETPCASCTSILDSLDGAARHLGQRVNLAVVAKSDPERIRTFADERGWRFLRLLSSRSNTYNRDYHAESAEGNQIPILNVCRPRQRPDPPCMGHGAHVRAARRRGRAAPRRFDLADLERARHDAGRTRHGFGLPPPELRVDVTRRQPAPRRRTRLRHARPCTGPSAPSR